MSNGNKRKHKTLTLTEKMEILNRLEDGEQLRKIAKRYDVGRSTVYDIRMNKEKILQHANLLENVLGERKTLKSGYWPEMESALYRWFARERFKRTITGEILRSKAKELYNRMTDDGTGEDFRASVGWLDRFKRRYGIRLHRADDWLSSECQSFSQELKDTVVELSLNPDQVYNACAITVLLSSDKDDKYYRNDNDENNTKEIEDSKNIWNRTEIGNNDRITIMLCSNASGEHKFPMLIAGKAEQSEIIASSHQSSPNDAFYYKKQSEECTSRIDILKRWFHEEFVPGVRKFTKDNGLPGKALLLLDNNNRNNNINNNDTIDDGVDDFGRVEDFQSEDDLIRTIFLPYKPNCYCCSSLYPMNQIVKRLIYHDQILPSFEEDSAAILDESKYQRPLCVKGLNLKDAIVSLTNCWKSVTGSMIQHSWCQVWSNIVSEEVDTVPNNDRVLLNDDDTPALTSIVESATCVDSAEEVKHCSNLNLDNEDSNNSDQAYELVSVSDMCETEHTDAIEPAVALESFNICLSWAEQNGISSHDVAVLRRMRRKIFAKLKS